MTTHDPTKPGSEDLDISLQNISKRYLLRKSKPFLVWEVLKRLHGRRTHHEEFWALRNVGLNIRRGEAVGVVGRNGSGKSTLLGILTGAIKPTTGSVRVRGRVGALLELGAGFHPDLTGRENIYLNASLLGLDEQETEGQFENILKFSELEEFIDVPIRNYSSGMHVRLGFSVAIHADPDILVIDEALAVGDLEFQQKCIGRIQDMKATGKTLLFVSHGLEHLRVLCRRAVWLEHGCVQMDGAIEDVLNRYTGSHR